MLNPNGGLGYNKLMLPALPGSGVGVQPNMGIMAMMATAMPQPALAVMSSSFGEGQPEGPTETASEGKKQVLLPADLTGGFVTGLQSRRNSATTNGVKSASVSPRASTVSMSAATAALLRSPSLEPPPLPASPLPPSPSQSPGPPVLTVTSPPSSATPSVALASPAGVTSINHGEKTFL
jgi:hypothetical protein